MHKENIKLYVDISDHLRSLQVYLTIFDFKPSKEAIRKLDREMDIELRTITKRTPFSYFKGKFRKTDKVVC